MNEKLTLAARSVHGPASAGADRLSALVARRWRKTWRTPLSQDDMSASARSLHVISLAEDQDMHRHRNATLRPYRRVDASRRVADLLRSAVLKGCYRTGPLPSEAELAACFEASRNTIRDALDILRMEGLIERRQGAGTFVLSRSAVRGFNGLNIVQPGAPLAFRVLDLMEHPTTAIVAEKLGIRPGEPAVFLERLSFAPGGGPSGLRASYFPAELAASLLEPALFHELERREFVSLVEDTLGLRVAGADVRVKAVAADESVAEHLGISVGSATILIERVTRLTSGRPIEYGFVRTRSDNVTVMWEAPV